MTTDKFQDILSDYMEAHKKEIAELRKEVRALNTNPSVITSPNTQGTISSHGSRCAFAHSGGFFYVPKDFQFPKNVDLRSGLRFWFNGLTLGNSSDFVKPFRHITLKGLHTDALKNTYKLTWRRVFKLLDMIEGITIPAASVNTVSESQFSSIYDKLLEFLRDRFSFCFTMTENPHITWTLGTWASRTSRAEVMKRGTDRDKSFLPPASYRNFQNGRSNNNRKRKKRDTVLYPHRQEKRQNRNNNNNNN